MTETITLEEAKLRDMDLLTHPINKDEKWILNNILNDMIRGKIEHAIVYDDEGRPQVARKGMIHAIQNHSRL